VKRGIVGAHRKSRSSACSLALVPASHQLLIPATNVNGISLAGGNALRGTVMDGTAEWVAVAAAEDMRAFAMIIVGRIMVERRGIRREGIVG